LRRVRVIARLDVKAPNLVKGIQFEGLRKLGNPNDFAKDYYEQGIDEIYYEDIVASLYERNSLLDIIVKATKDIFVPITVGGGLRTVADVQAVLQAGADKVAINTAAIKNPTLIREVSERFGSQCMVLSVQAKKTTSGWEAYYDNGRERSGIDVVEWIKNGVASGAGEILLTSVDMEGSRKGFDLELVETITRLVDIPVIASGGMGDLSDFEKVVIDAHADAVAVASALHYRTITVAQIRKFAAERGILVRQSCGVGNGC